MQLAMFLDSAFYSPFLPPVAGCAMVLGIVIASVWSTNRKNEMRSRERLECIARGIAPPPTEEELASTRQGRAVATGSLGRRRANLRLTGTVLLASSVGIILFFITLAAILQERDVLSGAAVGLIPFAMGVGFLIDTRSQTKEIEEIQSGSSL